MLTKDDLKAIKTIVKPVKDGLEKVQETQKLHTVSILDIEQKISSALELRTDVKEVREQVKDHEERISSLETIFR